jgi:hypothetical protein
MPTDNRDLIYEVIKLVAELDEGETEDFMFWPVTPEGVRVSVTCSDVFAWACADAEIITPENLPLLRKAYEDEITASPDGVALHAGWLFVARVRGERPQGAIYKALEYWEVPLFNDAGPEREINFANPQSQTGEYLWPQSEQYKEWMAKRESEKGKDTT